MKPMKIFNCIKKHHIIILKKSFECDYRHLTKSNSPKYLFKII